MAVESLNSPILFTFGLFFNIDEGLITLFAGFDGDFLTGLLIARLLRRREERGLYS